jgi:HPt (histidine-containing phosphotransfer) domain-containing protein
LSVGLFLYLLLEIQRFLLIKMLYYKKGIRKETRMTIQEFYASIGVEMADITRRLGSERIAQKFVLRFPKDQSYNELKAAIEAGNTEAVFRAAHTLKGVSLNLGIEPLGKLVSKLTDQVRGENPDLAAATATFTEVKPLYEEIIEKIGQIS